MIAFTIKGEILPVELTRTHSLIWNIFLETLQITEHILINQFW